MFNKIWQDFHKKLLRFITYKIKDKQIAEDILQEVFIKVHKNITKISNVERIDSWLFKICHNVLIDYYRQNKLTNVDDAFDLANIKSSVMNDIEQKQLSSCLQLLIQDLPEKYRDIILENELQQQKQLVIAQKHQLTLSAVKSRIKRGRHQLKEKLRACCEFEFKENSIDLSCKTQCGCEK